LFNCRTKFVAQNIGGFIERLMKTAQRAHGSRMQLSEQWLRTTGINTVEFASGAAFEVIVASCFKQWLLRPVRWWRNRCLTDPTSRTIFKQCHKFLLSEHSTHAFLGMKTQIPEWACCQWMLVLAWVELFEWHYIWFSKIPSALKKARI